ncbi:MAG: CpaF family protein [Lachnospiraceae bacterium]|jgi:pilus assembly protein CpaF|nr:CpaF family protein [Lachnospiraceae bacterium]
MRTAKEWKEKWRLEVLERMDLSRDVSDEEIMETIDRIILEKKKEVYFTIKERKLIRKELFYSIRKLDMLQELVDSPEITEIMVNGTQNVFVERGGSIFQWENKFEEKEKLEDVIQQIVAKTNRVVNETSPIVDTRLEDGSRVNAVLSPVALNGPILTIRRFPDNPFSMEQLIQYGSLSQEAADFLRLLVIAKYNIFISGGTGSGKTTFLNALAQYIPEDERIITIEDSAELQIRGIPNLVSLETRNKNNEGCREITIRDLIKASLRMRPDRIIIGEVRGGEALDMLQAMNTGHDGSLSTGHGNSSQDMLSRLETMVLMGSDLPLQAIRRQISGGIDIIIHLGRIRDKSRKVLEITEVIGYKNKEIVISPIFMFEETGEDENHRVSGKFKKTGELFHTGKWKAAGLYNRARGDTV